MQVGQARVSLLGAEQEGQRIVHVAFLKSNHAHEPVSPRLHARFSRGDLSLREFARSRWRGWCLCRWIGGWTGILDHFRRLRCLRSLRENFFEKRFCLLATAESQIALREIQLEASLIRILRDQLFEQRQRIFRTPRIEK